MNDKKFLTTSTFSGPSALKVSKPSPYSAPIAWKETPNKKSYNHFTSIKSLLQQNSVIESKKTCAKKTKVKRHALRKQK